MPISTHAIGEQAAVDGSLGDLAREQAATDLALAEHQDLSERIGERRASRCVSCGSTGSRSTPGTAASADLLRECIDGRVGPVTLPKS